MKLEKTDNQWAAAWGSHYKTYRPHPWRPILGFETVEVVPLPEQLVTNELIAPAYIPSGMSTEPLRYPNLVTGFERNPQHAARTALNTRYTQNEWKSANGALNDEADSSCKQSQRLILETDGLLRNQYCAMDGQTSSGFRIGERVTDSKNMRDELNIELGKLIDEMKLLTDTKRNVEKALQDLETPLHIAQECLYHRECRYGVDKTHDIPEKSLLSEIDNIRDAQKRLAEQLDNVKNQLLDCRAVQHSLESDVAHKESAIGLDSTCHQLNNYSRGVNFYGGIENFDPTICDRKQWQQITHKRLEHSQNEREKSSLCRTNADTLINNVSKSVWENWSKTNNALTIRATEVKETQNRVQMHLQKIQEEIFAIEKEIELILNDIRFKSETLKVAQTRLETRTHRLGMELCKDNAQNRLVNEVKDLKNSVQVMYNKLQEAEGQHQQLLKTRANLETDLHSKVNSLFIDKEKCLGLRRSFPVGALIRY
ncbi:Tektin-3 [Pseudolycoriella hygida]|uniref:Tektin n=1 Tax=Pseudolycoriella hygida TaxID=35572 RepID=A0A9Q0N8E1_9DIPT|nr:Tektin-3 [Pseudolycoriella hygida]